MSFFYHTGTTAQKNRTHRQPGPGIPGFCLCRLLLRCCLAMILPLTGSGQFAVLEKKLNTSDTANFNTPREKLFVHYDRAYYNIKDTMWLKGYILAANDFTVTDSTGIAYIEIINTANQVVRRTAAPCYWGRFQSALVLTEEDFPQGSYTLRAYTRWMRNFGDSLLFESRFTIINPLSGEWNARISNIEFSGSRISLTAGLSTNLLRPISRRKVRVTIRSKNRALLRLQTQTDADGKLRIDTLLKSEAGNRNLVIEIADKEDLKLQIPVTAGDAAPVDLQFLPEGGSLIAGKEQQVGFKALNVYGKGTDVKGVIKNEQGQTVASFSSIHKGMGILHLTPRPGSHYTAFPEGGKPVPLPAVRPSGTLLHVEHNPASDSIRITIDGTPDLRGKKFYFAAFARGISIAKGRVILSGRASHLNIARNMAPSGITRFTLYDSLMRPVNERIIFLWQKDQLRLSLTPHKQPYGDKDSVALLLSVRTGDGKPAPGSFSLAVIDTSQVKINPQSENILSYMYLSSDLKGYIEDPYYYFQDPAPGAVDALMLTQGWVNYDWQPGSFKFEKEPAFKITGKATNVFNKPFSNTKVTLFGKMGQTGIFLTDTTTNSNGIFTLADFPYFTTDSVSMVIRGLNKKGKAFNIGLEVDEPVFPAYHPGTAVFEHQNILLDTATLLYVKNQAALRSLIKKNGEYLDEVVIKTNKGIPGSKNLNKNGGSDQMINEKTLAQTPKATLLDVLYKQVKGFRLGSPPKSTRLLYMISTNIVRFIIDGVDLNFFYQPGGGSVNDYQLFLDSYLKYFSAEDVRGIEVMNYPRYNSAYRSQYLSISEQMNSGPARTDFSFVEITTQTGSGPFLRKTPGMYLYKPVVPVIAKQFYSPRYTTPGAQTAQPDLRTTVYWNPEVITGADGKAPVSFYTSESNSSYLIIVQGINLTGGMGILYQPLEVRKKETAPK